MNASGVLLALTGAWVIVQVIGGGALERLGVGGDWSDKASGSPSAADPVTVPGTSTLVSTSAVSKVGVGTWV